MSAIAFIGLGQMGAPMAKNLLKQGHQLNVFDVNPQAVQALAESGARAAATPAQPSPREPHARWPFSRKAATPRRPSPRHSAEASHPR